ncbi:hypothetical protein [Lichenifustis flavocetrariae]|uniref:Uncharacterized protein n=1 Tax=Lichenifustis flavocetrariae TaxID=2949735 RepID=A0AA42CR39_9HYPH|nr:hypothetical protein [Lichenifustis flavocetrariae]MCW6512065.1 hypothetical protein [Lichenifustis flavocetrariae]
MLHSRVLSDADKRAVLAAWASDAHAVPNLPAMRQLDSGAIVGIGTVLAALRALDSSRGPSALPFASGQGLGSKPRFTSKMRWRRAPHRDDGDDDPPPSPAAAPPPGVELELRRRRDQNWQLAAA